MGTVDSGGGGNAAPAVNENNLLLDLNIPAAEVVEPIVDQVMDLNIEPPYEVEMLQGNEGVVQHDEGVVHHLEEDQVSIQMPEGPPSDSHLLGNSDSSLFAQSLIPPQPPLHLNTIDPPLLGHNDHNEGLLNVLPGQPLQQENLQIEHLLPADLMQEIGNPPQAKLNLQVGFMRHQDSRVIDPVFESFSMPLGVTYWLKT
jgi:hypothetical protein